MFTTADVSTHSQPLPPEAFRPFSITSIDIGDVSCTVRERSIDFPFAVLRIYFSRKVQPATRALVVAPLSGAFAILMRDLVIGALRQFDEVAVTDWADARYVPLCRGRFGIAENTEHVEAMIQTMGPGVHVIAVCQAVTPALAATALLSATHSDATPDSLTPIGGPVDASSKRTRVTSLLRAAPLKWFERNVTEVVGAAYPGSGRRIYPRRHQTKMLAAYVCQHIAQGHELFWKFALDDGEDPINFPFYGLCWSLMDLPAELFLDTIRHVYQASSLANGTMTVGSRPVDLSAINRTALLTIEGENDDITSPGQTAAAHAFCPSLPQEWHRTLLVARAGHFSLFHGETCRGHVLPAIGEIAGATGKAEKSGRSSTTSIRA